MSGAPPPIQPSRSGESRETHRSSEPQKQKGREREFKLPRDDKEGTKEEPTDEVIEAFEKEKKTIPADVASMMQASLESKGDAAKISMAQGALAAEATKAIDQVAKLIKQMVETLRVGSVEGKQITSIDLKTSNDFLSNANLMITQLGEGKISVSFSNMTDANMAKAISAVEQNKAQLEKLVADLQAKGISLAELRIGDQTIALPVVREATTPPIAPMGTTQEGYREKQDERGGGREQEGDRGEKRGER